MFFRNLKPIYSIYSRFLANLLHRLKFLYLKLCSNCNALLNPEKSITKHSVMRHDGSVHASVGGIDMGQGNIKFENLLIFLLFFLKMKY